MLFPLFDEFGKLIKKTPMEYPYSYDGYVIYMNGSNDKSTNTAYSDRLRQEDYEKHKLLHDKYLNGLGDDYYNDNPEAIEKYLSEFLGKEIKLLMVMRYCNQSNGYPYLRFDYKDK